MSISSHTYNRLQFYIYVYSKEDNKQKKNLFYLEFNTSLKPILTLFCKPN